MGLRTRRMLTRGVLVAASVLSTWAWGAVPGPVQMVLQMGHAPAVRQQLDAVRGADGGYTYRWTTHGPGCCDSSGELTMARDLGLHLMFTLGNDTSGPKEYRATFSVPVPEDVRPPAQIVGRLSGTVSGPGRDPLLTSVDRSPIFTAMLNGVPVATLFSPPYVLTGAGTLVLPDRSFGGRNAYPGNGPAQRTAGLRLRFQLGAGGTVRFVTRWQVVPPPFPVAVLLVGVALLCLLVLVRQSRQSRQNRRGLAVRPASADRLR
ncbi:MAG: hypothetical protein B7Z66_02520 [Chromatiales bacterium 21-64-14]|nr:MAG: hypothetical protein B7Z66_02520 [Chromatiales bacterium 21-64-14]HQU14496.1 hypothetical protein [Gammaproteobacteria bacterium]